MNKSSVNSGGSGRQAQLRFDAENRLKNGTAPPTRGWALSADALTILYKLASTPDSAGEGLKLLHELQAHQVELDLQHEQQEANEREFIQELTRYKSLYDYAPVGYFVTGFDGQIIEGNRAGAVLFGVEQEELGGQRLDRMLAPECRATLTSLLNMLHFEGKGSYCDVYTGGEKSRHLRIHANVSPSNEAVLMVISTQD
jgi:PAS domain S-box-containing protein